MCAGQGVDRGPVVLSGTGLLVTFRKNGTRQAEIEGEVIKPDGALGRQKTGNLMKMKKLGLTARSAIFWALSLIIEKCSEKH